MKISFPSIQKFLILTIVLLSTVNYGYSQKDLMKELFKKGESCLNNDEGNCKEYFEKSIRVAKKLKSDTLDLHRIKLVSDAYKIKGTNIKERIAFCKEGIKLAREKNNKEFEWDFQERAGESYLISGEFDLMEEVIEQAIELADELEDSHKQCTSLLLKAQLFMSTARYPEAIKAALKAEKYGLKSNSKQLITKCCGILAGSYFYTEDYQLSAKYMEKSRVLYLEIGDTLNAMYSLTNWCNIQLEIGNPELVTDRLLEAIEYFTRLKLNSRAVFPMAQLGKAYNSLKKYDLAVSILEDAFSQSSELGMDQQAAYCAILLSESHYFLNNPKECLEYSTVAYNFHKDKQASQEYLTAFRKQARALMFNEQYKDASEILVQYIEVKDSVFNKEKMEEIAFLQEQFEAKEKSDKILLLEQEKKTIQNRNMGLIIGLILTAIIAWLLVKRKSIKIKLKQAENDRMDAEIKSKNKELTSQALHLAQKNELLISLKNDLASIGSENSESEIKSLEQKIKFDEQIDQNWEQFTRFFNETKSNFFKNLTVKHPAVGKSDLRMSALISMNLDSKEIASILNISSDGVKKARYRLRKKLGLESRDDLSSYLTQF